MRVPQNKKVKQNKARQNKKLNRTKNQIEQKNKQNKKLNRTKTDRTKMVDKRRYVNGNC